MHSHDKLVPKRYAVAAILDQERMMSLESWRSAETKSNAPSWFETFDDITDWTMSADRADAERPIETYRWP